LITDETTTLMVEDGDVEEILLIEREMKMGKVNEGNVLNQTDQPVDPPKKISQMIKWVGPSIAVAAAGRLLMRHVSGQLRVWPCCGLCFGEFFLKGLFNKRLADIH
jgi:hypothetical protein